jgi:hypothetical protein
MTFSAPLFRGLAVLALGATLALSPIAFAAAAPVPASQPAGAMLQRASDVETTASTAPRRDLAENCYIDTQLVKGLRGKPVVLRVEECD